MRMDDQLNRCRTYDLKRQTTQERTIQVSIPAENPRQRSSVQHAPSVELINSLLEIDGWANANYWSGQ